MGSSSTTGRCRWASPILAFLVLTTPLALVPLQGQQEGTHAARLAGRVTSEATEEPLVNARITLPDLDRSTLTDDEGRFLLEGLPTGSQFMEVHFVGAVSERVEVELDSGDTNTVRISLDVKVIPLPAIGVTVERHVPVGKLTGFYRRMENEHGHFITREEIEDRRPFTTSDLLRRVPGMRLRRVRIGDPTVASSRQKGCQIDYWVDGIRTPFLNLDDVPPTDIDGLEIYRGASEVPVQFKRPTTCAAIIIWTRDPGT